MRNAGRGVTRFLRRRLGVVQRVRERRRLEGVVVFVMRAGGMAAGSTGVSGTIVSTCGGVEETERLLFAGEACGMLSGRLDGLFGFGSGVSATCCCSALLPAFDAATGGVKFGVAIGSSCSAPRRNFGGRNGELREEECLVRRKLRGLLVWKCGFGLRGMFG